MTATATTPQPTAAPPAPPPATGTLAQRILAVIAEVQVKATGTNFQKKAALSIEDVEEALAPLLPKHGVLVRFAMRDLSGSGTAWRADVTAIVENAADPDQRFEDEWADTGGNPAAAYSFARKSYLKALFHLAAAEDDKSKAPEAGNGTAGRGAPPARASAPAPPPAANGNGASPRRIGPCAICAAENVLTKTGQPAWLYQRGSAPAKCIGYLGEDAEGNDRYAAHTVAQLDAYRRQVAGDVDPADVPEFAP